MLRQIWFLAAAAVILFSFSCVKTGGKKTQRTLNKQVLRQRPAVTTPKYGFRVVLDEGMNFDLRFLDQHWDEFSNCYKRGTGSMPSIEVARQYTRIVTKRRWNCVYHEAGCTAEIDIGRKEIYLTRLNLHMDKHEFAHLYGLLDRNDDLTQLGQKAKSCFPMKSNK